MKQFESYFTKVQEQPGNSQKPQDTDARQNLYFRCDRMKASSGFIGRGRNMNRFDIYILNRKLLDELIQEKKTKKATCEFINHQTGIDYDDLYSKCNICNPKKKTVPYRIASSLQSHKEDKDVEEHYDFSRFILDVRRLLILMNSTAETLFLTNEKAILSIMLIFYEEKEWWTPQEIYAKSTESGSNVLKERAIKEALKNASPNSQKDHYTLFEASPDGSQFRIDVDKLINHISDSECVIKSSPSVLT